MSDSTSRLSNSKLLESYHVYTYLGKLKQLADGEGSEALTLSATGDVVPADPAMATRFNKYRGLLSDKVISDADKVTNARVMNHLLGKIANDGPQYAQALRDIPLANGSKPGTPVERAQEGRYVTRAVVSELHDKLAELILKYPDNNAPVKPTSGPQADSFERDNL